MASYETIPAAAAEDGLLLETPKPKTNLKGLVAGAAMASFVLGMVAATAVTQHAIKCLQAWVDDEDLFGDC